MVGGLARFRGRAVVVVGHQRGHGTAEQVARNFGMPRPEGFRKAVRLFELAERFRRPVLTLVDTQGAYPGIDAEQRGQAEAIATCIRTLATLRVPIVSTIIGEGGSGGALALGLADRMLMQEHAWFSVLSPEGCASILFRERTPAAVARSAALLRLTATDLVTLGRSGVKVTRLAFGTGSFSGQVQRDLGQEGFTRLVRHAYDRGIRFFETAESYGEMHKMLGIALKGIPRESYQLMSKVTTRDGVSPQQKVDELRTLANTEYFDILLLHWQHTATWPADTRRWQDAILEAESKKAVVSHGASVHGLPALRQVPGNEWLNVAMIRVNHTGKSMDAEDYATQGLGNVPEVVEHVKKVRNEGMGVISMKLIGEGTFNREDRQKAMKFAFRQAGVDCVTVGYKSTGEIDEAIENLNMALA